jgi:hypothetical protein
MSFNKRLDAVSTTNLQVEASKESVITNQRPRSGMKRWFPVSLALCCLVSLFAIKVRSQSDLVNESQTKTSRPPVVESWEPKTGSVNSVVELSGYRLYPQEIAKSKAFFIQNGVELPARTGGGSSVTNDADNGPQTLEVILPEGIVSGSGQIVIEVAGRRSVPATITVTDWKLPVIRNISPVRGAPGTYVDIQCNGFHINDEIEITDVEGNIFKHESGGSSSGTGFIVPKTAPEGPLTVRIGNSKIGKGQFTAPFIFTVTNDPLPLELNPAFMEPVAPGQWLDLQIPNHKQLKTSERTEVAFKQAGRTMVVALPKPFRPHVEVPSALSPGKVQLQARMWRDGKPAQWSEPVEFELTEKPKAPAVAALRLAQGNWVQLWPGPDRAKSFIVSAGNEVVINGHWPVADASKLKVTLLGAGETIELSVAELNEKADWFGDMRVRLPESLRAGEWRMIVSSEADAAQMEVPIVIRVKR